MRQSRISDEKLRTFGNTGLRVPSIMFGTAAFADVPHVTPDATKLMICGEWFRHVAANVFIDAGGSDDSAMAAQRMLGRALARFEIGPHEATIHVHLDCKHSVSRNSLGEVVLQQLEETCQNLGGQHRAKLVSIRNPQDNFAAANSATRRAAHLKGDLDAYRALSELKAAGQIQGLGVAAADWRIAQEVQDAVPLDFVILIGCLTVMQHPPKLLEFLANLAERRIAVVMAGVFHGGFLEGGQHIDSRGVSNDNPADQPLLAWRKSFAALCHGHGVAPTHACIQFALSAPGVVAVALESSHPDQVAVNVHAVLTAVPQALWQSMKEEGLLAEDYSYLG